MGPPMGTTFKIGNSMISFGKFWNKKCIIFTIFSKNFENTYIVQNISPSLHGNALKDSDHGVDDVVKVDDAPMRPPPSLPPGPRFVVVTVGRDRVVLVVEACLGVDGKTRLEAGVRSNRTAFSNRVEPHPTSKHI